MFSKFSLLFIFLVICSKSYGWGHHRFSSEAHSGPDKYKSNLIHDIYEKNEIIYCISDEAQHFSLEQLNTEFLIAIQLWINATVGPSANVSLKRQDCSERNVDVKIIVNPEPQLTVNNNMLPAYYLANNDEGIYQTLIFINPLKNATQHNITIINLPETILGQQATALEREEFLNKLSFRPNPISVENLSREMNLKLDDIFYSTYSILVHELGHAFGLCDTYNLLGCDPQHSSRVHPSSIMKTAGFFSLTQDDHAGIQAMIERIKSKELSSPPRKQSQNIESSLLLAK